MDSDLRVMDRVGGHWVANALIDAHDFAIRRLMLLVLLVLTLLQHDLLLLLEHLLLL